MEFQSFADSKKRRHDSLDNDMSGDIMIVDQQQQQQQQQEQSPQTKRARYQDQLMVSKQISQSSIVSHMPTYPHLIVFDAYLETMYAAK